jgi:hypothetical protein
MITTTMGPRRCAAALAVAAALIPGLAMGQGLPFGAGAGIAFERYEFDSAEDVGMDRLTLRTIPLAAHLEPARWLAFDVVGAHAEGELLRPDGTSSTISGFTDTELRVTVPIRSERASLSVTGVAILPTGIESQDANEAVVAGVMAADLLPLRITNWGGGGGYALSAAAARAFGTVNLGFSAGYRIASDYDPLESGAFTFRPGNELRLRAAVDRNVRGKSKVSLHATLFTYSEDQLDGANLYTSGNRVQLVGSYAFPLGFAGSAVTYAGVLHRAEGSVVDPLRTGTITTTADLPSQQLFLFGTGGRLPMGRHRLLPSVDVRLFRRDDGVGQGYVIGLGSSAEVRLSGMSSDFTAFSGAGLVLVPSFTFRFGELLVREEAESRFTGLDLGLGIRVGGGR